MVTFPLLQKSQAACVAGTELGFKMKAVTLASHETILTGRFVKINFSESVFCKEKFLNLKGIDVGAAVISSVLIL